MIVSELIEALKALPGDLEVLVSQDEEGNGFNKLYYGPAVYWIEKNADKHGYVDVVYIDAQVVDEEGSGWDDEVLRENAEQRVVIWP